MHVHRVQEAEGGLPAAELQQKLTVTSDDDKLPTLNGRIVPDTTPASGPNGTVFDDF